MIIDSKTGEEIQVVKMGEVLTGGAPRSRSEVVEHALRRDIVLGLRAPGSVLREMDLAQQFDCAQGTIREALMRLSEEGLVMRRARRDTHVAISDPDAAGELLRIRHDIECRAVSRVIEARDGALRGDLEARLQLMRLAAMQGDEYALLEHDCWFHLRIFQAADLAAVEPVLLRCLVHTQRHKVLNSEPDSRDLMATANRHVSIIEAIGTEDAGTLQQALSHHIATIVDYGPQVLAGGALKP
jgi:DNA-binding GntR family transcriptional regulator